MSVTLLVELVTILAYQFFGHGDLQFTQAMGTCPARGEEKQAGIFG